MTAFFVIAVLLTAAALLCVLWPLLGREAAMAGQVRADKVNLEVLRDQLRELDADLAAGAISEAAHRDARADLERRVVQDVLPAPSAVHARPQKIMALVLALALPALGAGLYLQVGNPAALAIREPLPEGEAHLDTPREIVAMVQALAERLKREPGDSEGWYMLARSYTVMGRIDDAALAYAQVAKLVPDDPDVLADYADALATARGASLEGEPARLVARALELDPRHPKALALAGSAAFARGDYADAQRHWQAALEQVPCDSEFARTTAASIAEARRRMGPGAEPGRQDKAQAAAAGIGGTVELDPALRAAVKPGDTVFVYARAVEGPRLPLAIAKATVADLPMRFSLDDTSSMVQGARLSDHASVMVTARISRTGSATPAPGDLEGTVGPVSSRAKTLVLRIDTRRE